MSKDIYEACRNGDLSYVITALESKIDLTKKDDFGFTPLHCAAMGSNSTDPEINLKIIKLLVEAGSNLESLGGGGRTALYLLAEFSPSMTPIEYLIEKGANPDLHDEYGNHVTVNAMTEESQFFFAELTNREIEEKIEEEREPIKLNSRDWKRAEIKLSKVFEALNNKGLIALEDSGYTQSDGFEDCSEEYHKRKNRNKIKGFCFYTNQDKERAKEFGLLPIGIWGAPEGGEFETIQIGKIVVNELKENGFDVTWNGQSSNRPEVYLKNFVS